MRLLSVSTLDTFMHAPNMRLNSKSKGYTELKGKYVCHILLSPFFFNVTFYITFYTYITENEQFMLPINILWYVSWILMTFLPRRYMYGMYIWRRENNIMIFSESCYFVGYCTIKCRKCFLILFGTFGVVKNGPSRLSTSIIYWKSHKTNEDVIFARQWLVMTAPFINLCVY